MWYKKNLSSWLILLLGALALAACGGGGGGSGSSNNQNATGVKSKNLLESVASVVKKPVGKQASPASCTAISLSSYKAAPGDIITVTGLPSDFKHPFFRSLVTLDPKLDPLAGPLPLFPTSTAGEYAFAVPPYMLDLETGGKVALELSDSKAQLHCPGIDFTIDPLPQTYTTAADARQSLDQLRQQLEDWTDKALKQIGRKPADLETADEKSLSNVDQLLWLSKRFVSSDDAGALTDSLAQLTDDDAITLANLFAVANTQQRLQDAATALSATSPVLVPVSNSPSTPVSFSALPAAISVPHISCEKASIKYKYDIKTVEQLSEHMKDRKRGTPFDASAAGKFLAATGWYEKINSHLLSMLQKQAKEGSKLFERLKDKKKALGKVGKIMSFASDVDFVAERVQQAMLAMEPHEISAFELAGVEDTWIEDRPAADTMTWSSATISATGKEYNLYRVLLDVAKDYGGKWVAEDLFGEAGAGVYYIATQIGSSYINKKFDEIAKDQCFRLVAPTYGPITFTDANAKWTKTRVRNGADVIQVDDEKNYHGIGNGKALLEVVPRASEFPSESGSNLSAWINAKVEEVRVAADPVYKAVKSTPKTFGNIKAEAITYNKDGGDHITATADKGSIGSRAPSGDILTLSYTTPPNLSDLPAHINYQWNGKTLPNGRDYLRKSAITFDKRGHITLAANKACLTPGETATITATIDGFPSADAIAWTGPSLSAGSSDLEKIFTAGALGSYTIEAFSRDDASVSDDVKITVANSCIAKSWNPFVHYELDGDGTYGDGPGCGGNGEPDNTSHEVKDDAYPTPPAEGALWVDKSETYTWSNPHSSLRYSGDTSGGCYSGHLNGSNNSSATYSAESDGTLGWSVDVDMTGDVKKVNTTTFEVDDSFTSTMFGYYYIPITEDTQLHLEGSIACRAVDNKKTKLTTKGSVMITPYDDKGQMLLGWKPGGVSQTDFPHVIKDIACQGNEMNFFDKTISIATVNGKRPSKVVLFVSGGLLAIPYPVDLTSPGPLADGTYSNQSSVDFEIRVTKQ